MPFSIHTMAWLGEHCAFVVEEFIQNGGSLIMMSGLSHLLRAWST
jgi:hypothetical protein